MTTNNVPSDAEIYDLAINIAETPTDWDVLQWGVPFSPDSEVLKFAHVLLAKYDQPCVTQVTASEAVYAFAAWLTTREQAVTFSGHHEASTAADLVDKFVKAQGWAEPRDDYTSRLKTFPTESCVAPSSDEDAYVIDRMGKLLAEIAVIIRGQELPLHRHGYADLPERVAALKALAAQPSVPVMPDGWKLVPIEPTERMTEVGRIVDNYALRSTSSIYGVMLAVAPTPPADDQAQQDAVLPEWWPDTPEKVRSFMDGNYIELEYGQENMEPHEDDKYLLTAHDLIGAFEWVDEDMPEQQAIDAARKEQL